LREHICCHCFASPQEATEEGAKRLSHGLFLLFPYFVVNLATIMFGLVLYRRRSSLADFVVHNEAKPC
jgi:hypothetical protein